MSSTVPAVAICGPGSPEFEAGLLEILGGAPKILLKAAIPYSVIVGNHGARTISFFGVRFDMVTPKLKKYSVLHYADSLRNPQKGDFLPGARRFVCAEPEYTALVLRGDAAPKTRGRMNLDNLRQMLDTSASLDCVAFEDGQFAGPDSQRAFERLAHERAVEVALTADIIALDGKAFGAFESVLSKAVEDADERARRNVARKLLEALKSGGTSEAIELARAWRYRIPLWR